MLQTANDRLRQLIGDLTEVLKTTTGSSADATTRQLRQTLGLLHAAAETLDELTRTMARPPLSKRSIGNG